MPIKRLFKSDDKDVNIESMMKKVDVLESQVKKLNTVDLHLKRILELEKTLKLYELRKKQDLNASADKTGKLQKKAPNSFGNPDKNKHSGRVGLQESGALVTQLICNELEPFKQQMESLNHKIYGLEVGLEDLKKEFSVLKEKQKTDHGMEQEPDSKISEESKVNNGPASVIYQDIKIEKVYLDRYEQNNNFAQLGIKELGGQLNIGATYGSGIIPKEVAEQSKEAMESMKEMKEEFESESNETETKEDN